MTDKILVSVIMCNYNYEKYLHEAITSVINQTYNNFELIIVDDGSTDNSRDIINSFVDDRIITIFQENSGQAAAFNAGYANSTGNIICFLDSDDWWDEEKLETVVSWHNFLTAGYSILQHGLSVWDNGNISPYKSILPSGDCFTEMCDTGAIDFFVPTSGISIPRNVAEKVFPLPESLRICADAYLTRASFIFGDVYSIPNSYGYYRKHQNTVYNNKEFAVDEFLCEQLFPLLDKFYSKNNVKNFPFKERIHQLHKMNKSITLCRIFRKICSFLWQK